MKRYVVGLLVAAVAVFALPSTVRAEFIEVSGSPASSCILPVSTGIRTVYVSEVTTGSTAVRFRLVSGPGVTMTYVSETHFYPSVGDTQTGLTVCYGECVANVILIAEVQYMAHGTDQNCSGIQVVPFPGSDTIEVLRCDNSPASADAHDLLLITGVPCGCPPAVHYEGTPHSFGCPVPVASSTWSAVKALYR